MEEVYRGCGLSARLGLPPLPDRVLRGCYTSAARPRKYRPSSRHRPSDSSAARPLALSPASSSPPVERPVLPVDGRSSTQLRRDLWVSTADGAAYSLMVGFGETYLPAFALALGQGAVAAGLLASAPLVVGAVVQLLTPAGAARVGSNRWWVIGCTALQAVSFLPLIWWAVRGSATLGQLLVAASLYWTAGMAGVPAWNAWMAALVPVPLRTGYFAQRNRLGQLGLFIGFAAGGLLLQAGERRGLVLPAFAVVFGIAAACRVASTAFLCACSEPRSCEANGSATAMPRSLVDTLRDMRSGSSGRFVVAVCCFVFGAQIAAPYFAPYMLRDRGFSYLAFMVVMATSFLAKVMALPWLGRLASRIGSVRLLWLASTAITPLSLLWLVSDQVANQIGVQVLARGCWAAYELAVSLLLFEAIGDRERAGVVSVYGLAVAVATVAGAGCGGVLLRALGEDRDAYFALFIASSLVRLFALPLARDVRRVA